MTKDFDTLLREIADKHNGIHKEVVKELTAAVWADKKVLRQVVDRYVEQMVQTVCYDSASRDRKRAKGAALKGVEVYKPRFGDDRESIIESQNKADQRWLEGLRFHRLFGGLYLYKATTTDVEASIAAHRENLAQYTAGVMNTIQFEENILALARRKRKKNISDVLSLDNAKALRDMMKETVAA